MIRRSTTTGAMLCLLLAGACNAAAERSPSEPAAKPSQSSQSGKEMVEITIRLPDGRIIKRKEPRIASRVDTDIPVLDDNRPRIVRKDASNRASTGQVETLDNGVTGGSNTSAGKAGSGGGGGGGSSTSRTGGGGGGGSGDQNPPSGGGGHSGGSTNDDFVSPVQPDTDHTVRFYAWDNTGTPFRNIQEAYIADPVGKTPERLASRIAQQVRSDNPDKIVIRFWKEFEPAARHPFDITDPRELVDTGGYSLGVRDYWSRFALELKNLGVVPDYLIFDQEDGISFWQIPTGRRRAFFEALLDPSQPLSSSLPASMRGVRVEDFLNYRSQAGSQAFIDYNQFATEFRARFIRRTFADSFNQIFGRSIPVSNYGDLIAGFPVYQYTGREEQQATVGGISAPVVYIDYRGDDAVRYNRTEKDHRWNRLIDQLNEARSSAQPGLTTPWISPPGYGRYGPDTWARANELDEEKWLWETMMAHMLASGIDTFILWNPETRFNPNAAQVDAWMDEWLALHPTVSTNQLRSLEQIPLDADQIETNGVITTYNDFVTMMNVSSVE